MSSKEKKVPYLDFNLSLILKIGVWNDNGLILRMSWFTVYMLILYTVILIGTMTRIYNAPKDIPLITECLSGFMSYGINCQKLVHLIYYEKELQYLMCLVKNNFFNEIQKYNPAQHEILMKRDKEVRLLTYLFAFIVGTCCTFLNAQPIMLVMFSKDANGTASVDWTFPWALEMPFDTSSSVVFWIIYAYLCTIGWFHVLVMPGCDNFYIALLNHAYGQCLILRENLENIYDNSLKSLRMTDAVPSKRRMLNTNGRLTLLQKVVSNEQAEAVHDIDVLNSYYDSDSKHEMTAELEKEMKYQLKECLNHHKAIMKFVDHLEIVLNKPMLSQFFTSTIVLCSVSYQIIMFSTDFLKVVGMMFFLSGEMLQLFMYCYFCDKITQETGNIANSAYFSKWHDSPLGYKRSLMIMMARSQKPTFFTVGKFADLTLDTFASILKGSYTYLMMLIELNE